MVAIIYARQAVVSLCYKFRLAGQLLRPLSCSVPPREGIITRNHVGSFLRMTLQELLVPFPTANLILTSLPNFYRVLSLGFFSSTPMMLTLRNVLIPAESRKALSPISTKNFSTQMT